MVIAMLHVQMKCLLIISHTCQVLHETVTCSMHDLAAGKSEHLAFGMDSIGI